MSRHCREGVDELSETCPTAAACQITDQQRPKSYGPALKANPIAGVPGASFFKESPECHHAAWRLVPPHRPDLRYLFMEVNTMADAIADHDPS